MALGCAGVPGRLKRLRRTGKRQASGVGMGGRRSLAALRMDLHRLSEERSRAYHQVIADRLRGDLTILERARARVDGWISSSGTPPFYALQWREVLCRDVEAIVAFLVVDGELARELRQSSPFAGVLSPEERWQIWRHVAAQGAQARDSR